MTTVSEPISSIGCVIDLNDSCAVLTFSDEVSLVWVRSPNATWTWPLLINGIAVTETTKLEPAPVSFHYRTSPPFTTFYLFITNTSHPRIAMEELVHICKPNPISNIIGDWLTVRTSCHLIGMLHCYSSWPPRWSCLTVFVRHVFTRTTSVRTLFAQLYLKVC